MQITACYQALYVHAGLEFLPCAWSYANAHIEHECSTPLRFVPVFVNAVTGIGICIAAYLELAMQVVHQEINILGEGVGFL